jgi:hypothetical protein
MVWRMSLYERRRKGNAFRSGAGRRSGVGNTHARRRGSGHVAVLEHARTQSRGNVCSLSRDEPTGKPAAAGVYVSQHLSLAGVGKAHGGKPRSEPDSGNPTVRDRRGASGNVAHGGNVNPPCNRKGGAGNPPPTSKCAHPSSIPTEQPTSLRDLRGESPRAVNCPIRTASISGARGGNDACSARKETPRPPCGLRAAAVGTTWVASKPGGPNISE